MQASAPDLELLINNKIKDVNSFNNSMNNIMLMMKFYEQQQKKKKYNHFNLINNLIQTVDGHNNNKLSTTSTSLTFSIIGVGFIVIPYNSWRWLYSNNSSI